MKQNKNLLLIAALIMLLISSHTVCGQPTEKYLICSENRDNISYDLSARKYTAELDPFSVSLPGAQEEHAINLVIAADVDIYSAYMRLAPVEGELSPTDVSITMNDESIIECQGEFTEVECSVELRDSLKEYLDTKKGECPVKVPLMFTSQNGGTIRFEAFSVRFRISPVKELEPLMDPEIGLPKSCFSCNSFNLSSITFSFSGGLKDFRFSLTNVKIYCAE